MALDFLKIVDCESLSLKKLYCRLLKIFYEIIMTSEFLKIAYCRWIRSLTQIVSPATFGGGNTCAAPWHNSCQGDPHLHSPLPIASPITHIEPPLRKTAPLPVFKGNPRPHRLRLRGLHSCFSRVSWLPLGHCRPKGVMRVNKGSFPGWFGVVLACVHFGTYS